ncbi:MAG: preprotein translocase subunit YajC [Pseudomonadota bacterium]|nr:preprotein translocase subunit YajC [Pseudomonadota bacterium]
MFISNAYAQNAEAAMQGTGASSWIMIAVMFAIMWLFVFRPQAKRHKEHQQLINSLKKGDKIVTDSGIYGLVTKLVDDSVVEVEIAEGVRVEMVRNAVAAVTGSGKVKASDTQKAKAKPKSKKKAA